MEIKTAKYIEILELCPKNEIGERLHKELYNSTYITHEIVFNDKSLTLLDKNQALEQLQSVVYDKILWNVQGGSYPESILDLFDQNYWVQTPPFRAALNML